jgi:DNA-binding MarR family transcriptional regulator
LKEISSTGFTNLISYIRECSNLFLEKSLKEKGLVGLVPAHGQILFPLLSSDGSLTLGEIAKMSGRAKSTITGMADTLEKYDYIERISCMQDKRSTRVALTEKGLGVREIFSDISRDLNRTIFKDISEEDQLNMMRTLIRIRENLLINKNN